MRNRHSALVICPSHRDRRELPPAAQAGVLRLHFHDYASIELEEMVAPTPRNVAPACVHDEIERIVLAGAANNVDAVLSSDDYPGSTLAAIVANRLGLPGTPVAADLLCQHKYFSRLIQRRASPDATPQFALLEPGTVPELAFPFFIKPVKSFFSVGAFHIDDLHTLRELTPRATLPEPFFRPLDALLERYVGLKPCGSRVLAEGFLAGSQATFEGYAFEGSVHPVGIVDSVMHPGTIAFERFDYPSTLPKSVQSRMAEVAASVMDALGFTHGLFNIEFRYDAALDRLGIVEINPRMASQFADLYEKVDGYSTYSVLLDLALGFRPSLLKRAGRHAAASSCVLRTFEDARVLSCPSKEEVQKILDVYPDARVEVLAEAGDLLSEQLQDGCSFRYAIVNIGGQNRGDVSQNFNWCRERLTFCFERAAATRSSKAPAVNGTPPKRTLPRDLSFAPP